MQGHFLFLFFLAYPVAPNRTASPNDKCTSAGEPPFHYSSGFLVVNNRPYCQKKTQLITEAFSKEKILLAELDCKGVQALEGLACQMKSTMGI